MTKFHTLKLKKKNAWFSPKEEMHIFIQCAIIEQNLNNVVWNCCGYRLYKLGILAVFLTYGQLEKTVIRAVLAAGIHWGKYFSFELETCYQSFFMHNSTWVHPQLISVFLYAQ